MYCDEIQIFGLEHGTRIVCLHPAEALNDRSQHVGESSPSSNTEAMEGLKEEGEVRTKKSWVD